MYSGEPRCVVVIPCYNEADRLLPQEVIALSRVDGVQVLLVDDGSTDRTLEVLKTLAREAGVSYLALRENSGKAEAVRRGLTAAVTSGASVVGYIDADFSVPSAEVLRLLAILRRDESLSGLLGSRVMLAGRSITRSRTRHYVGRMIATGLSSAYGLDFYDTQCGAKFFRNEPALRDAIARPFVTRWLFDVELLVRLERSGKAGRARYREEPLEEWTHVKESKVTALEVRRVLADFLALQRHVPVVGPPAFPHSRRASRLGNASNVDTMVPGARTKLGIAA